jgi:hypothetical protein
MSTGSEPPSSQSHASQIHASQIHASQALALPARRPRDPRLDFFRGAGMFIILVSHVPWNGWAQWIPARFGFSDATEIFVFCSGMASAIAFGAVFDRAGWLVGAARILYRVWQIYWAHICLTLLLVTVLIVIDARTGDDAYLRGLNLHPLFADPKTGLVGLFTLTYVPNYFDILPMYLGILALVPAMMIAERAGPLWPIALSVAIWLVAGFGVLGLPAEPWSDRTWYFNPFAWQLIFFLGFGFQRGWLPVPAFDRRLLVLALAVVVITVPFAWHRLHFYVPELRPMNEALVLVIDKTHLGVLRVVHFLALAYLAMLAAGAGGRRLAALGRLSTISQLVGRQALPVFMTGIILAQLLGVFLDIAGRDLLTYAIANLVGFAVLIATAAIAEWFKNPPWARRPAAPARVAAPASAGHPAPTASAAPARG